MEIVDHLSSIIRRTRVWHDLRIRRGLAIKRGWVGNVETYRHDSMI